MIAPLLIYVPVPGSIAFTEQIKNLSLAHVLEVLPEEGTIGFRSRIILNYGADNHFCRSRFPVDMLVDYLGEAAQSSYRENLAKLDAMAAAVSVCG